MLFLGEGVAVCRVSAHPTEPACSSGAGSEGDLFASPPAGAVGGGRCAVGAARSGLEGPGRLFRCGSLLRVFLLTRFLLLCLASVHSPNTPFSHALDGRLVPIAPVTKGIGCSSLNFMPKGKALRP